MGIQGNLKNVPFMNSCPLYTGLNYIQIQKLSTLFIQKLLHYSRHQDCLDLSLIGHVICDLWYNPIPFFFLKILMNHQKKKEKRNSDPANI
jgi:hypothetical protein